MDQLAVRRGGWGESLNPRKRGRYGNATDAGMVIAEMAVAMLAVTVILSLVIGAIALGAAHVRTQDAARSGARLAARGEPAAAVVAGVRRSAPGAQVDVQLHGDVVTVAVNLQFRAFPGAPQMTVAKRATVETEFQ